MIQISITAAVEAIERTLPLGSVTFEATVDAMGNREIWVELAVVNKLRAIRGPGSPRSPRPLCAVQARSYGRLSLAIRPPSTV
jgi:hypothetical protein